MDGSLRAFCEPNPTYDIVPWRGDLLWENPCASNCFQERARIQRRYRQRSEAVKRHFHQITHHAVHHHQYPEWELFLYLLVRRGSHHASHLARWQGAWDRMEDFLRRDQKNWSHWIDCSARIKLPWSAFRSLSQPSWSYFHWLSSRPWTISTPTIVMDLKIKYLYFLSFRIWWCLGWLGYRCAVCISKKIQGAYDGIHDVCVEASKKQSLVSYHFRNDAVIGGYSSPTSSQTTHRNVYIEVSISDQPVYQQSSNATGYPTVTAASTPSFYISNDTTGEAPEVRLQKLNNMKYLLSTQEYEDKRAAILAAM